TAFAQAGDNPSPEAHLYRGVWLYRRGQLEEAEDEFTGALNLPAAPPLQQDITAWRSLAAVANGSCGASRDALQRSMGLASPFFPRDEARKLMSACRAGGATTAMREPRA